MEIDVCLETFHSDAQSVKVINAVKVSTLYLVISHTRIQALAHKPDHLLLALNPSNGTVSVLVDERVEVGKLLLHIYTFSCIRWSFASGWDPNNDVRLPCYSTLEL